MAKMFDASSGHLNTQFNRASLQCLLRTSIYRDHRARRDSCRKISARGRRELLEGSFNLAEVTSVNVASRSTITISQWISPWTLHSDLLNNSSPRPIRVLLNEMAILSREKSDEKLKRIKVLLEKLKCWNKLNW